MTLEAAWTEAPQREAVGSDDAQGWTKQTSLGAMWVEVWMEGQLKEVVEFGGLLDFVK